MKWVQKQLALSMIVCIFTYGFLWAFTFNFLWFLVNSSTGFLTRPEHLWRFLLGLAWNTLCPEWPFLAMGVLLGLLTCWLTPRLRGTISASLILSILPVGIICFFFSLTSSSLLPALVAVLSSFFSGSIVARTWQSTLFARPFSGRSFAARRVFSVMAWLVALSIPFRLFEWFAASWTSGMGTEVTETNRVVSPNGAYVAVIHDVNPGAVGDYSDVIIRPRHAVFDLFADYSASSHYMGVGRIQWSGKCTLNIWHAYDAGEDHWNDVRIVYVDTRGAEEKKEDDAMK